MPLTFTRTSGSEAETHLIGCALGSLLRPGDVVLLDGPLGAGKTTLVRAVAQGMGLDTAPVASPTFVVVHEYGGRLIHVDAYRLKGPEDLDSVGWERLKRQQGSAAMMIEWAERLGDAFPGAAHVRIDHTGESSRELTFVVPNEWGTRAGFEALRARAPTVCPITGRPVAPDSPTYPFADERARMADLNRWFTGSYTISRGAEPSDIDEPG